ncbi:MAG: alpha/beta hydrolase [Geodermatophilaceae bacterium]|jgi:pimeloyl-ACP methyl ester carboxylesterase|nr:alpha/beta hydrolase [Geodermatophilaceae bacterium]
MRTATLSEAPLHSADEPPVRWPGRRVPLNGGVIYVRSTPGGPDSEPALYVHGLGGASTNWTDYAGLLSDRLDGQALDLFGFGRSGPAPRSDYSIEVHVRTVIAAIEGRGGPVHLIGNSLGGLTAILVTGRRPDLVTTLTLISPAVPDLRPPRQMSTPLFPLLLLPGIARAVERRLAGISAEDRVRAMLELCFADMERVSEQRLAEAIDEAKIRADFPWASAALAGSFRSLVAAYLTPGARNPWRIAAAITKPTLIIWGDQDKLVNVRNALRLAAVMPDARLLVLPGVGHTPQLEDPISSARATLALLDESRATARLRELA